jgi:hypothetical protein
MPSPTNRPRGPPERCDRVGPHGDGAPDLLAEPPVIEKFDAIGVKIS